MNNNNYDKLLKLYNDENQLNNYRLILATLLFNERYNEDLSQRIKDSEIEYFNNNLGTFNGCCKYSLEGNKFTEDSILVNIYNRNLFDIQATLIHELRHHLVKHTEKLENNNLIAQRGLQTIKVNLLKMTSIREGIGLEEIYNTYITGKMVNNIKKYKNQNNTPFDNYVNSLGEGPYIAYKELMEICMPLLTIEKFTDFVDFETYKGNIDKIENKFNDYFKQIMTYNQLKKYVDYLLYNIKNPYGLDDFKSSLNEINKTYTKTIL
ncbi:MAG: hypothetical protein II309_02590 [Bacilli bacterium]|nr:hypothetical protein [Bacilli bacterium]